MTLRAIAAAEAAPALERFDAVIDVRSPAEFAEDHLPGAVNWPVLDDEERRAVGTLYVKVSPLTARKVGAAMVARNIAGHVERWVQDKPREWQPLVYCWRGGQRSGALAWFLDQIGFRTTRLNGGYKAFRAVVRDDLAALPQRLQFTVIAGRTGSGKTRLLHALAEAGAQVLDLEALACHRGSVLGGLPDRPQPSQKAFDTLLWQTLRGFDEQRPVFVESESRRVGALQLPDALVARMREHAQCVRVQMDDGARVQLLLQEYGFFAQTARAVLRAAGRTDRAARQGARDALANDGARGALARAVRRADARALRPAVRAFDETQLRRPGPLAADCARRRRRSHAARGRA